MKIASSRPQAPREEKFHKNVKNILFGRDVWPLVCAFTYSYISPSSPRLFLICKLGNKIDKMLRDWFLYQSQIEPAQDISERQVPQACKIIPSYLLVKHRQTQLRRIEFEFRRPIDQLALSAAFRQLSKLREIAVQKVATNHFGLRVSWEISSTLCATINTLHFFFVQCQGEHMNALAQFTQLKTLHFEACTFMMNEDFRYLSRLPLETVVFIKCIGISNNAIAYLPQTVQKLHFSINNLPISNKALSFLPRLTNLQNLTIDTTDYSTMGFEYLADCSAHTLTFSGSISARTLDFIILLKKLRCLHFFQCRNVDDNGFAFLAEHSKLEVVTLEECPHITAKGIAYFITHSKLKKIVLIGSNVSNDDIDKLRKLREDIEITIS